MRTTISVIIITISFVLGMNAQDNRSFSLEEAVAYAMNNSIDIKDGLIDITDAHERVTEAKSIGIPQANLTMDYTRFLKLPITILPEEFGMGNPNFNNEVSFGVKNSFNTKLEVSSLLFDGSYLVGLQAAKLYTNQAELQLDVKKDEVGANVRDAYLPALIIRENKKILNKNLGTIKQLLHETTELYKAGFVEQLDIDRLELSKANLLAELENLEDKNELILNYLKFQMGYPVSDDIVITDDLEALLTIPTKEELEGAISFSNHSNYIVLQSAVTLNEMNVKRFKAGYLPQLVAFGSYGVTRQGDRIKDGNWSNTSLIGIQLNVPIFDGFNKKAKIQRARLQLEKIKNNRGRLESAIELQVKNARASYKNAIDRLKNREKNTVLAEKIYNTSQIKYKEGIGSSLEITQAEQGLFQAQSNYINAKYELLVAKVNLDKALGN